MTRFIFLILILSSVFVSAEQNKTKVKPTIEAIDCKNYADVQTELGLMNNNVWNKDAAGDKAWQQCLVKKVEDGQDVFGWQWDWPSHKKTIFAYPQIKLGSSPWAPTPKLRKDFPLKISELQKLTVNHHLETSTNGDHNTATSLWLVDQYFVGEKAKPSIIAAEMMIWTYTTKGHFSPAGNKIDEIEIGNQRWEIWFNEHWEDQSKQNQNKWAIVTFKSTSNIIKAELDVLKMLNYALSENLLPKGLYVADLELGNEVMRGSGEAWVRNFTLEIKTI